jgi:hypothetical protein
MQFVHECERGVCATSMHRKRTLKRMA